MAQRPKNTDKSAKGSTDFPEKFTLRQRLFGPIELGGNKLGFIGRLLEGWMVSHNPYFSNLDDELRSQGR